MAIKVALKLTKAWWMIETLGYINKALHTDIKALTPPESLNFQLEKLSNSSFSIFHEIFLQKNQSR